MTVVVLVVDTDHEDVAAMAARVARALDVRVQPA
jgi:hypothetical protein